MSFWSRAGWLKLVGQIERRTSRSDGEDLLQDAYVRMVSNGVRPTNIEAYLVRSAVNRGNDAYRMEEVRERNHADIAMTLLRQATPLQEEVLLAKAQLERVAQGIDRMPRRTREVFLLQRLEGLKYREIAIRLAISQSAVEKHMTKAISFLGEWMRDW
ncbi:MAG TPA: sigma-70 family RNA polymerase sigma factor [Sphingomonadaceae bacterium]|nr:sigma-70 family RNA polymerase sigma factor [Sphingomonadaceae bacterium]